MHNTLARRSLRNARKYDYRLFWLINSRLHSRFIDIPVSAVNRIDTALGNPGKFIILLFLVGGMVWQLDRGRFIVDFAVITAIIVMNVAAGYALKRLLKVRRPLYVFGDRVRMFSEKLCRYSMPSGHTQIAFCLAVLLAHRFPGYAWMFYPGALLVGLYRIYVGSHFPSDVVIGAAMGFGMTTVALDMLPLFSVEW
jgi:undecaprenyl-diphosphatase